MAAATNSTTGLASSGDDRLAHDQPASDPGSVFFHQHDGSRLDAMTGTSPVRSTDSPGSRLFPAGSAPSTGKNGEGAGERARNPRRGGGGRPGCDGKVPGGWSDSRAR